jgi:hypothetical protein
MLSKEVFKSGISKLLIEYGDRGFSMSKEKSMQWYEHMINFSESDFTRKIDTCLRTCKKVPFMADILDSKDTQEDSKEKPYWLNAES